MSELSVKTPGHPGHGISSAKCELEGLCTDSSVQFPICFNLFCFTAQHYFINNFANNYHCNEHYSLGPESNETVFKDLL